MAAKKKLIKQSWKKRVQVKNLGVDLAWGSERGLDCFILSWTSLPWVYEVDSRVLICRALDQNQIAESGAP